MPIECKTPMSEIDDYLAQEIEKRCKAAVRQMCVAGEKCVNKARDKHSNDWEDQTGNLRSSIGYVVAVNGKIVNMSDFKVVKQGADGREQGKSYATRLAAEFSDGIVLIVVAGMKYAYYVQKRKDVLTGAQLEAETIIPELLKQIR